MPFRNVADADQVALLRRVFNEFCEQHHITNEQVRLEAADMLMAKFSSGIDCPGQLAAELRHAFICASKGGLPSSHRSP